MLDEKIVLLEGVYHNYDWGGFDFIPHLIGFSNPSKTPFAEYWLGAHPLASAKIQNRNISLCHLIEQYL